MDQDTRYITPDAIGEVRRDLREDLLPLFAEIRRILEENRSLDFPAWGPLGEWTAGALYRSLIDAFVRDTDAALGVVRTWEGEHLRFAEHNWRAAEDLAVRRVGRP
ncbi:hypothetical protein E1295_20170 [Nonomuraea mesophila]|uniref:Uncharacterized protein n=1 Tax=Nonomuraea mesophila TaxID=2530382 RepID=A0A4R5FFI2_9ACTN|nr:hypothetical protein [Nonomuraea mesophila]TDE49734.1 hypothetical protein E1295_20170 [Nonomuraea mesophila]